MRLLPEGRNCASYVWDRFPTVRNWCLSVCPHFRTVRNDPLSPCPPLPLQKIMIWPNGTSCHIHHTATTAQEEFYGASLHFGRTNDTGGKSGGRTASFPICGGFKMHDVSAMENRKGHSPARKIAVGIAGGLVLLAGVAMIVLPGPAFVVIPAGLAILASEFEWARRWLHKARDFFREKFHRKSKIKT
jgi:hypothetical protein